MLRNPKYLLKKRSIFSLSFCKYSNEVDKLQADQKTVNSPSKNEHETQLVPKNYDPKLVKAEDMKWRKAWHEENAQHFNFLRTFYKEDTGSRLVKRMSRVIDMSPSGLKKWFMEKQEETKLVDFSYLPARNEMLGDELAAAHFIVSRGGAIKFVDEDRWVKANDKGNYVLPRFRDDDKFLEAIDCLDMDILYESIENFRNLQKVKWLSLNGCNNIDDWCLDALGNIFSDTVVYLDLRNCPKITYRGLGALAKMKELKILYLDDFYRTTTYELTCLLLQEMNPYLDIKSDPVTFEVMQQFHMLLLIFLISYK